MSHSADAPATDGSLLCVKDYGGRRVGFGSWMVCYQSRHRAREPLVLISRQQRIPRKRTVNVCMHSNAQAYMDLLSQLILGELAMLHQPLLVVLLAAASSGLARTL